MTGCWSPYRLLWTQVILSCPPQTPTLAGALCTGPPFFLLVEGSGEDKVSWMPPVQKRFEVKAYYRAMVPNGDMKFPWKSIWKPKPQLELLSLCRQFVKKGISLW